MTTTWLTVARAEIPAEWIALRREALRGHALRAAECPGGHTIELKTQQNEEVLAAPGWRPLNAWGPLGWHLGALRFATAAERDEVLAELLAP